MFFFFFFLILIFYRVRVEDLSGSMIKKVKRQIVLFSNWLSLMRRIHVEHVNLRFRANNFSLEHFIFIRVTYQSLILIHYYIIIMIIIIITFLEPLHTLFTPSASCSL